MDYMTQLINIVSTYLGQHKKTHLLSPTATVRTYVAALLHVNVKTLLPLSEATEILLPENIWEGCQHVHFQVGGCQKVSPPVPSMWLAHVARLPCLPHTAGRLSASQSRGPSALYEEGTISPLFSLVHAYLASLSPQGLCFSVL